MNMNWIFDFAIPITLIYALAMVLLYVFKKICLKGQKIVAGNEKAEEDAKATIYEFLPWVRTTLTYAYLITLIATAVSQGNWLATPSELDPQIGQATTAEEADKVVLTTPEDAKIVSEDHIAEQHENAFNEAEEANTKAFNDFNAIIEASANAREERNNK